MSTAERHGWSFFDRSDTTANACKELDGMEASLGTRVVDEPEERILSMTLTVKACDFA